jgi:hypothetical protein
MNRTREIFARIAREKPLSRGRRAILCLILAALLLGGTEASRAVSTPESALINAINGGGAYTFQKSDSSSIAKERYYIGRSRFGEEQDVRPADKFESRRNVSDYKRT